MEFECNSVEDAVRDALWYMNTNHRSPMRILWNGLEVWQSLPEPPVCEERKALEQLEQKFVPPPELLEFLELKKELLK